MTRRAQESPTRVEVRNGQPFAIRLTKFALHVKSGADTGSRAVLSGNRLLVGRGPSNDLALSDELASRIHAEVSVTADGFRILDLGSRNGTFLRGRRIVEGFAKTGDVIEIGDSSLVLEEVDGKVDLPLSSDTHFGGLLGKSVAMRRVLDLLERAAATDAIVLLGGETGTGKEEAARAVHAASRRSAGPFAVVDCGSIPGTLLPDLLFGHERGAFTGAAESDCGVSASRSPCCCGLAVRFQGRSPWPCTTGTR